MLLLLRTNQRPNAQMSRPNAQMSRPNAQMEQANAQMERANARMWRGNLRMSRGFLRMSGGNLRMRRGFLRMRRGFLRMRRGNSRISRGNSGMSRGNLRMEAAFWCLGVAFLRMSGWPKEGGRGESERARDRKACRDNELRTASARRRPDCGREPGRVQGRTPSPVSEANSRRRLSHATTQRRHVAEESKRRS